MSGLIFLSIIDYAKPGVVEARINNIILLPDSYCSGLGCRGYLDNDYDFLKEYLTTLRIL